MLEFLSLPQDVKIRETKLESAILSHLKDVLMELGRGFSFVARQKHMRSVSPRNRDAEGTLSSSDARVRTNAIAQVAEERPDMTDRCTILIAGIGTSPVVFTETEWALCHQKKPMVPDEIVVLVTKYAKGWIKDCTWFVTPGPPESHMRKVDQYTKDGKLIAEYRSAAIASRATVAGGVIERFLLLRWSSCFAKSLLMPLKFWWTRGNVG